jgi:tetratricopeptide (TPR) repeat protein
MGMTRTVVLALLFAPAVATFAGAQSFDEHIAKGRQFFDSAKYDDAVKSFEKAIKVDDKNSSGHLWLARALGNVAQKANVLRQPFLAKRAKSEFDKAAELDPNSIDAHDGLMGFYLAAPGVMGGSKEKAKAEAAIIARLNPFRGHFAAARIANDQKDLTGEEKALRAAAAEFPDSARPVNALANFLSNNNRVDEVFPVAEKFLARHPDDVLAQWYFARTAAITGKQLDKGEEIIRRLMTLPAGQTPRVANETLHYRLGDIYLKRGDKAKAKAEYEQSLKINGKFEPAKKALEAVK